MKCNCGSNKEAIGRFTIVLLPSIVGNGREHLEPTKYELCDDCFITLQNDTRRVVNRAGSHGKTILRGNTIFISV